MPNRHVTGHEMLQHSVTVVVAISCRVDIGCRWNGHTLCLNVWRTGEKMAATVEGEKPWEVYNKPASLSFSLSLSLPYYFSVARTKKTTRWRRRSSREEICSDGKTEREREKEGKRGEKPFPSPTIVSQAIGSLQHVIRSVPRAFLIFYLSPHRFIRLGGPRPPMMVGSHTNLDRNSRRYP